MLEVKLSGQFIFKKPKLNDVPLENLMSIIHSFEHTQYDDITRIHTDNIGLRGLNLFTACLLCGRYVPLHIL